MGGDDGTTSTETASGDEGERWRYDPSSGDRYAGYSGPGGGGSETGYGSDWRDGQVDEMGRRFDRDYGRRVAIKVTDPRQLTTPSFFLPWVVPEDGDAVGMWLAGRRVDPVVLVAATVTVEGTAGANGGDDDSTPLGWLRWSEKRDELGVDPGSNGGGGPGVEPRRHRGRPRQRLGQRCGRRTGRNICSCNNSIVDLDTEYMIEPGNMVGPTFPGRQLPHRPRPDRVLGRALEHGR